MKAILVIDVPKDCEHCDCSFDDTDYGLFCSPLKRNIFVRNERPSWCPLRPLPSKKYEHPYPHENNEYAYGWNDCLKEITGETK